MSPASEQREERSFAEGRVRAVKEGDLIMMSGPPTEREAAEIRELVEERARRAERELPGLIARLRGLLGRYDPLDTISQLSAVKTSGAVDGPDDTAASFGTEARLEYLTGLALSCPGRSGRASNGRVVTEVWDLVEQIFALEADIHMRPPTPDLSEEAASAQFLLRFEHLVDRTQGYIAHLVEMADAAFRPIEERCRQEVGFSPLILPRIVFACHRELQRRLVGMRADLKPLTEGRQDLRQRDVSAIFSKAFAGFFEFGIAEIAATVEAPESEVRAALDALSTPFGALASDLRPKDPNRVRRFPVIALGEDTYFFSLQWNPIHEVVPWFLEFLRAEGKESLERRFLRCRDRAAEELTKTALARVFGTAAVHGPLDYEVAGTPTELDCLVDAWPLCMVVEVKAHRVTESVRRGSADRIRRLDADLGKARAQAARAAGFLESGPLEFRVPGSTEPLRLAARPREIARLAVSWERADPLTLTGGLTGEAADRIWNVSLADLLLVTEILDDPASFCSYLELRTELARDPDFQPFMEADLLGGFLARRLAPEREISERRSGAHQIVGYQAGALNEYFTARDLGFSSPKPTCGVPSEILKGLSQMAAARDPGWPRIARGVVGQSPEAWAGWGRQLHRARRGARNLKRARAYPVRLEADVDLLLLISRSKDCFEQLVSEAERRPGVLVIAERQGSPRELKAAWTAPSGPPTA